MAQDATKPSVEMADPRKPIDFWTAKRSGAAMTVTGKQGAQAVRFTARSIEMTNGGIIATDVAGNTYTMQVRL